GRLDGVDGETGAARAVLVGPQRSRRAPMRGRPLPGAEGRHALPLAQDRELARVVDRAQQLVAEQPRGAGELAADAVVGPGDPVRIAVGKPDVDQDAYPAAHREPDPGSS